MNRVKFLLLILFALWPPAATLRAAESPGLLPAPAFPGGLDFGLSSGTTGGAATPFSLPAGPELLRARLVPESSVVAAGNAFRVVLELSHAPGAYTYWTNPGGPGVATSLEWELPAGFVVSGPLWPAPEKYDAGGGIVSYIHKGVTRALYTITPPADFPPGAEIAFAATVNTQVCTSRACIPTTLPVSFRVTATDAAGGAQESNPALAAALAALPARPEGWTLTAAREGAGLALRLVRAAPGDNSAETEPPADAYFFDAAIHAPVVDTQKPQTAEVLPGGELLLRLPLLAGQSPSRLAGVLATSDSPGGEAFAFEIDLPLASAAAASSSSAALGVTHSTWAILLFAFLGGLLLNVMPCVFPVIGLKIMAFARQAAVERRTAALHGAAYGAGVLASFWALALAVIGMGRGWGAQLQSDWFLLALCHLFLIMALNMAGVFDVGSGVSGAGRSLAPRSGLVRSFLTGLLAVVTSTPCSAPFLGTALAYALSLPAALALGVFTLMGLGFALPYVALSLSPALVKRLPKPGAWLEALRQFMAFPLFATTAYLLWTIEAMFDEWRYLLLLFGMVFTAMACWLYGRFQRAAVARPGTGRLPLAFAVVCLASGLWLGVPKGEAGLRWGEWSPEEVARLRSEGRAVYVDFTARWCATCQLNKRVYGDAGVEELIREKNVALLKADWTLYDERITSTLRDEFSRAAVPVTALYAPGSAGARLLPDLLTAANVAEALGELP